MHRLQPLLIDTGRNPFQVWILVGTAIAGAGGLLGHAGRSPVAQLLPGWARTVWYAGLLVGGAGALVALRLKLPLSLLVERSALLVLAGMLSGYAIALLVLTGGDLSPGLINLTSAAVAAWWRVWQITRRDLPRLRAALTAVIRGDA
jgi:hypothetical protein